MSQEINVEQQQQQRRNTRNDTPSVSNRPTRKITIEKPVYLSHLQFDRDGYKRFLSFDLQVRRATIFDYLKQLWLHDTDAISIVKEKQRKRKALTDLEYNLLDVSEGRLPRQQRRFFYRYY